MRKFLIVGCGGSGGATSEGATSSDDDTPAGPSTEETEDAPDAPDDAPLEITLAATGDILAHSRLNLTANATRANTELGWSTKRTLEDACEDLWRWTENNPQGYRQDPPKEFLEKLKAGKA